MTAQTPVIGAIVLNAFRTACATHGTPQSTVTDNGFVFTTRHRGGPNGFEVELAKLGVAQKDGSPNHHGLRARSAPEPDPEEMAPSPTTRQHRDRPPGSPQGIHGSQHRRPLPHPLRQSPRQRIGHSAPRRTNAPHQTRHGTRQHTRAHAHPRPERHRRRDDAHRRNTRTSATTKGP